jgi:hypothetical protein
MLTVLVVVLSLLYHTHTSTSINQASQNITRSGKWTVTKCTGDTCDFYHYSTSGQLQTYYVADTLHGDLYAVPYSPTPGQVVTFTYTHNYINLPGNCNGYWNNAEVVASCIDGTIITFKCTSGPCLAQPIEPNYYLTGTWLSHCYNSFIYDCKQLFANSYIASPSGKLLMLSPTDAKYRTALLQTFSDNTMIAASDTTFCFAELKYFNQYGPLIDQSKIIYVICGDKTGQWGNSQFECKNGACEPGIKIETWIITGCMTGVICLLIILVCSICIVSRLKAQDNTMKPLLSAEQIPATNYST